MVLILVLVKIRIEKSRKDKIEEFNRQLIYAHCVGIEPELSIDNVRAANVDTS